MTLIDGKVTTSTVDPARLRSSSREHRRVSNFAREPFAELTSVTLCILNSGVLLYGSQVEPGSRPFQGGCRRTRHQTAGCATSVYHRVLTSLNEVSVATVSAKGTRERVSVSSAKLRKDLSHLGSYRCAASVTT